MLVNVQKVWNVEMNLTNLEVPSDDSMQQPHETPNIQKSSPNAKFDS